MMARYWGYFAEIHRSSQIRVEEIGSYEDVFASLADVMLANNTDVEIYMELVARQGGPVLELGCGSGRLLLRLAELGHEVVGLDLSVDMLRLLQEKLENLPASVRKRVRLIQADASRFELRQKYPTVVLPYCTVCVFVEPEKRLEVLRHAAKHLAPGGIFVLDYPTFNWDSATSWNGKVLDTTWSLEGRVVKVSLGLKVFRDEGCILENTYMQVPSVNGVLRHCLESKRLAIIDPDELECLVTETGMMVTERRSTVMQENIAERHTLFCTPRPSVSYPLWHPYQPLATEDDLLVLVEGKGCRVRDDQGKEYIDSSGGLWSTQCGLAHPDILEAITQQLEQLTYSSLFLGRSNRPALDLARELVSLAPAPLPWVYLTGSGSESVELSIKLARLYHTLRGDPDRKEIVYLDRSYHGTFFGSMGVSGLVENGAFAPLLPGVSSISTPDPLGCPANTSYLDYALTCAALLKERILQSEEKVAAFIVEPILGSAGMIIPPLEYFEVIQDICREHGVLLILDEVATGFGRTGRWFASEHFGLKPDMLLLAKGINSGYLPLGAVLFSAAVGQPLVLNGTSLSHGSSHNGNPVCAAAALATINVIRKEGLVSRSAESGHYFLKRLQELRIYPCVREVRGLGLMLALLFLKGDGTAISSQQVSTIFHAVQNCGILTYPAPCGLLFLPSLTITHEEIDIIVETLHGVVAALRF